VYQLLQSSPRSGEQLRRYLPSCYSYDSEEALLVVELLRDAQDFREYHSRLGYFSSKLATVTGHALSSLHRLPKMPVTLGAKSVFSGRMPWVLSLHRPGLRLLRDISSANIELIRIIQASQEFRQMLDELRQAWRADALIHNDIKWDNCLVYAPSDSKRRTRVKIVDWEFADLGDPCWDVGAVFSNYLSFWLMSIPITGEDPPDRFLELAQYPLERMQPAIRAFWRAYARGMELDGASAEEWLLRTVKYGAAQLIQIGFEHMQRSAHLNGNLVCLLQLSLNIMQRPQEAIAHLLGIPLWQIRAA
jgi:aminoglycoside phosphotransferase (APT) family kinase protein